jgi:flagellar motility protein MotE (MotC chaperone)
MKSVVIISLVTFALIFGGAALVVQRLPRTAPPAVDILEQPIQEGESPDRILQNLAHERDRIQREKEEMLMTGQQLAVQQKVLDAATADLKSMVGRLQAEQAAFGDAREKSARKLAKVYENMKPEKAAPILSTLDTDVILEIVQRMNEKAAAKLLAHMDAGLAAQISLRMSLKGDN